MESPIPKGSSAGQPPTTWLGRWQATPLYLRILLGVGLGLLVGLALRQLHFALLPLGKHPFWQHVQPLAVAEGLAIPSRLVLRVLGALAAPLILLAVVQALMHAQIPKGSGLRLFSLLLLNTLVAIFIGLAVANVVRPGKWAHAEPEKNAEKKEQHADPLAQFLENVPKSLFGPLGDQGSVLSVIFIAVAFGIALRRMKDEPIHTLADAVSLGFRALIVILHWIIEVIPLAVFGIVASIIGTKGFSAFVNLGAFILAVLLALALQLVYYLVRIRLGSWARPLVVLRGMRDALVMAFSTASSTATMPVTYACLREKVGLRERSASLGALVGANFNNDGTALYEAMAALFVSQMLVAQGAINPLTGLPFEPLTLTQQLLLVATSVVASVGAAGIPEAGLVTMTLVFKAVHLPTDYIPVLLTIDWFLDRCRTTVNVMGDVNVSCLLDGREREEAHPPDATDRELSEIA
ncbi:MAG: dicarboxylate/amino acid:cation symporter [Pirellulaceae bacterium]|nr:dicarboxylate/amino acid:cation symporter [Pirellulaceae bacterium]